MAGSGSNCSRTPDDLRDQLRQQGIVIVYDNRNWNETSATVDDELERAMESGTRVIIIEPQELGEMTSVWIGFGNFINKLAIYNGLGALATAYCWPNRPQIYCGLGTISLLCTTLYGAAWQFDPCCKYKLEKNSARRENLPLHLVTTSCPVVLARKRTTFPMNCTRILLSFTAVGFCLWNLYQLSRGKTIISEFEIIPKC